MCFQRLDTAAKRVIERIRIGLEAGAPTPVEGGMKGAGDNRDPAELPLPMTRDSGGGGDAPSVVDGGKSRAPKRPTPGAARLFPLAVEEGGSGGVASARLLRCVCRAGYCSQVMVRDILEITIIMSPAQKIYRAAFRRFMAASCVGVGHIRPTAETDGGQPEKRGGVALRLAGPPHGCRPRLADGGWELH